MNIESDATSHPALRVEGNDESVDSRSSFRSGGMGPEELPKGYTPRPADVCCGRGKKNWRHHGNASFRQLIHSNVAAYMDATTKHDKTLVVKSIVDIVRSNGGRFLKQGNDGAWYDIGDSQAKEKVGHSLRDQVTALSKQKKDAGSVSSLRDQVSGFSGSQRRDSASASPHFVPTPHRTSISSYSPYSHGQGSINTAAQEPTGSPSPLNIMRSLPTDLSGILEQIHFPSIQSPAPHQLEASSSSLTTATSASVPPSLHSSTQNFNRSFTQGMVNFFEPLDESMEPIPIREFLQQQQTQEPLQQQQQQPPHYPSGAPPRHPDTNPHGYHHPHHHPHHHHGY